MIRFDILELDGNLLARDDVGSEVDIAKAPTPYLATNAIFITDSEILPGGQFVAKRQGMRLRFRSGCIHHCTHLEVTDYRAVRPEVWVKERLNTEVQPISIRYPLAGHLTA